MNLFFKLFKRMDTKNNTGNRNSGYGNSGYGNSGDWNSGYGNSTNREAGIFNTTQGKVRLFNKQTDKTWDEINHPDFPEFYLTKWISESEMTDEEKVADPQFLVRQGYLKKFEYKEAWTNFWRDTDKANKDKFLALPNFDQEIFYEITGIKIGENQENQKRKEEILKKIDELKAEAEKLN